MSDEMRKALWGEQEKKPCPCSDLHREEGEPYKCKACGKEHVCVKRGTERKAKPAQKGEGQPGRGRPGIGGTSLP